MKINKLFQALQLLPFFITRWRQRKTETTAELVLRSALELHVCSHLNVAVTLEFSQLNSSLDSLAHEINLRQYHKEFIWTSPDDRACSLNEVWVDGLEGRDEQTCRNCSQLSSVSSHAERIAFLSGFQFGFSDNCGGQATFGLWLRVRDVASPPGSGQARLRAVASDPRT